MVGFTLGAVATEKPFFLPQRLSGAKQGLAHVCAVARGQGKTFALVLRKSHACDNAPEPQHRQCMLLTQAASDGCNPQLRNRFSIFHLRMGRYSSGGSGDYQRLADQNEAWREWDRELAKEKFETGPGLLIVDVAACRLIRSVFLYDVDFRIGRFERIRALNEALGLTAQSEAELTGCFTSQAEPSHPELWREMHDQGGNAKSAPILSPGQL